MRKALGWLVGLAALAVASAVQAGNVEIVDAKARASGSDTYNFSVTLKHGDTGWDHYANAWEIVGANGDVLGIRKLLHPHVDEQPFTRSLSGVKVPAGLSTVTVRAYDNVHGLSDATFDLPLPGRPQNTAIGAGKKELRGSH